MVIYLISSDGHRDSIDLEYYFTTESQVKKYIRNIQVDFEKLTVRFEYHEFGFGDWAVKKHYFYKINKYENS